MVDLAADEKKSEMWQRTTKFLIDDIIGYVLENS